VWFEGHHEALAIAPNIGQGKEFKDPISLQKLIDDLI
jgi:hypothetical protein